jgi:hypothetical protein
MRKLALVVLCLAILSSGPAEAAKTVPFKNQRSGQFCKTIDINKTVTLLDGSKLVCLKEGSRARWKLK